MAADTQVMITENGKIKISNKLFAIGDNIGVNKAGSSPRFRGVYSC
jgi:hypothetical protein